MIKTIDSLKESVGKDKRILALLVFGSFAREEKYNDIDICLVIEKKYEKEYLEVLQDYLKLLPEKFDISIFQKLPMYVKEKVLKEGQIIFCRDNEKLYNLAEEFLMDYKYFKPKYEMYLEAVLND